MLKLRVAILGFWIGVIALFSFAVAPAAFAVMPSTQLAGGLVPRVLSIVEIIGIGVGIVLFSSATLTRDSRSRVRFVELAGYSITVLAMAFSRFYVSSRLYKIRVEYGDVLTSLPLTDTVRAQFDFLHRASVVSLSLCLVIALALVGILVWSRPAHA